jgi:hypothetical protein
MSFSEPMTISASADADLGTPPMTSPSMPIAKTRNPDLLTFMSMTLLNGFTARMEPRFAMVSNPSLTSFAPGLHQ